MQLLKDISCNFSEHFPFALTADGVYANTDPMKIIDPLNVKYNHANLGKINTHFARMRCFICNVGNCGFTHIT